MKPRLSYLILAWLCLFCGVACDSDESPPAAPTDTALDSGVYDTDSDASGDDAEDAAGDGTSVDVADGAEGDASNDTAAIDASDDVDGADSGDSVTDPEADVPMGLPDALPFELTRADDGDSLSEQEIADFTHRITGLWESVDYWTWVLRTSHGVHASTGQPDYLVWWHDVDAIKDGDLVTFRNSTSGGGHNVQIPTSRVLAQAAAGYLATGDEAMGRVVEQYAKHYVAFCEGLVYDGEAEGDDNHFLMARNIVTQNHTYTIDGDRDVAVDYTVWYSAYDNWNTSRFNYPDNPTYGDIWVTNMRSKDDVPHIYLAAAMLRYVMEYGVDAEVREAAASGYETIRGFAADIVDSGYHIRTRDADGDVFTPTGDLASLVKYEAIAPNAECNAKLATALIASGEPLDNDCDLGISEIYEGVATATHYFNYAIINNFHVAAIHHALINRENAMAQRLLEGLAQRIDAYLEPADWVSGADDPRWERDMAVLLVQAAAVGLPLTSREARLVVEYYDQTIDPLLAWPRWDLWDDSVPDGVYNHRDGYRPGHGDDEIKIQDIAWLLYFCYSPFRNPEGAEIVDCDVVLDRDQWGE